MKYFLKDFFFFTQTVEIKMVGKHNQGIWHDGDNHGFLEAETAWIQISALPLTHCRIKLLHFSKPPAHPLGKKTVLHGALGRITRGDCYKTLSAVPGT